MATLTPAPAEPSVVERAMRGERGAFGELYQAFAPAVRHYVYLRVRDTGLAEDLTQDVFLAVYKGIGELRSSATFRAWLYRIAHNRVLNHWRAAAVRPRLTELPADFDDHGADFEGLAEHPMEGIDRQQQAADLATLVGRLTGLQQQVLALRFVAGLSIRETAEAMSRSENAVKNLQFHALAALRRQIDRQADER